MTRARPLLVVLAAVLVAPALAVAQPGGGSGAPVPPPPPPPDQPVGPEPAPGLDEAAVRDIVDREVARIIAEREARLAAERKAADERAAAERPVADADGDYLSGESGFGDVRLAFTLTNENLLVKPGETIPSVPGWRFGRPNSLGTLFFDNYDTRFSGYETLSHAILYKNYRKDHLEAEAGFVLRINELSERKIDLSDGGSYLLVSWWKDKDHVDPTRASITVFPVSADRMRLGYSYRLSWGGNDEWKSDSAKPGMKVQYDFPGGYAFVGAKSAITLDKPTAEQKSQLAVLFGAGFDINDMIRVEANGGYYDKGSNELSDVENEDVRMFGGSFQIAAHKGMPVTSSVDYKLYKNDPERIGRLFQKAKYPGGLAWLAMLEVERIGQTLKDPEMSGSTKTQWGNAGDINVRVIYNRIRMRLDASFRDLAYLLHTVPSLPAYQDFAPDYEVGPNFFAAAGADINFDDKLTLGVTLGMDMPATLKTPNALPGVTEVGESTAVVRNVNGTLLITILPTDKDAVPAIAAKATAQYDFGEVFSAVADVYLVHDENTTRLERDNPEGPLMFKFGEFNQLGMNFTLQARF